MSTVVCWNLSDVTFLLFLLTTAFSFIYSLIKFLEGYENGKKIILFI